MATASDGKRIRYYDIKDPFPGMEGDIEGLMMLAGQSVGLISNLPTAAEIITTLMNQAGEAMKNSVSSRFRNEIR
jgi:NAD(P)H-dependent flavin oxidoreductase YrpB (nitropropane dioxygenase family)